MNSEILQPNTVAAEVRQDPIRLHDVASRTTMVVSDGDHAIWNEGIKLHNAELQIDQYSETSRDNFAKLRDLAFDGVVTVISTGKSVNAYPLGRFFYTEFCEEAVRRGMAERRIENDGHGGYHARTVFKDTYIDPATGRIRNEKGEPIFFILSIGNGAEWYDVLSPDGFARTHELPHGLFEVLADPFIAELIHASTDPGRRDVLARTTPWYQKPDTYHPALEQPVDLDPDEYKYREQCIQRIGQDVCITPFRTKLNLVLSLHQITTGSIDASVIPHTMIQALEEHGIRVSGQVPIKKIWHMLTDIDITDGGTLLDAVRMLLKPTGVNIFHAHANGTHFIDVNPPAVDKMRNILEIQQYVAAIREQMALPPVDFTFTVTVGDGIRPTSNDAPMIYSNQVIGMTNKPNPKYASVPHAPVLLGDLFPTKKEDETGLVNSLFTLLAASRA